MAEPKFKKPISITFGRVTLAWGDDRYSFPLGAVSTLQEGKWSPSLHPRWPKGTPRAGEFMQVGQRFIGADGKEWQIAHIVKGKVITHRAEGKLADTETGVFHPKKVKGNTSPLQGGEETHVIEDAKKEAAPRLVQGGKAKTANVTTADAYVDPSTHDPSIEAPQDSKISTEEWKRFGEIDQEHYADLMERFGKYSPSKAKTLIDESYQDYEAEVQAIVKNAYSSQYGASTGFTLSLSSIFQHITKSEKKEVAKLDAQRQRALELQGRHKDVVAWDLYNRTRSPDIAVFHKSSDPPAYWQEFIAGERPVMSGLSQSFNFGANFQFGNNTLATPLAIRNVLMSSYSAQPIPGSKHFPGELEVSTAEQLKIDDRSITFSLHDITANQKKWLMGVTKAPASGATIERFKEALQSGEMLPTPPAPPDIQMSGQGQKLWIDPPPEAAEVTKEWSSKLPAISGSAYNPAELDKAGPWANKDAVGNPMATVAKESELKPGDYMMGLKGTLYLIVEDPGDETGFGLRYVKVENGQFTGESYPFEGGGVNQYFKLSKHFELPDPHKDQKATDLFDPFAWVNGDKEAFLGNLEKGEKFKVNGNPYEVLAQLNGSQTQITDLANGKVGTINTDYKTYVLVPKDGYVPSADGEVPKLTPAKGMTLAYEGQKHMITNILKDGTVKAKPSGGKTIAISPDDAALDLLYDPTAHKIGSKIKASDLQMGDLFHGGRGSIQRPYVITGFEGNKVKWRSLDTGEEGVFTKAKVVRKLDNVDEVADPDAPSNTPLPPKPKTQQNIAISDLAVGDQFSWNGQPYELKGFYKGTAQVKNLQTNQDDVLAEETQVNPSSDLTIQHLLPTSELDEEVLELVAEESAPKKIDQYTTIGSLNIGDYFQVDGEVFAVLSKSISPEQNATVAPVLPSGALGAPTTFYAYPDMPVVFKGDASTPSTSFAQTDAPNSNDMADLQMEGGFVPYKSKYGSGGKYTHDKISEMQVGAVFQDKKGQLWKVKANDHSLIVTNGVEFFQANPDLRGKVVQDEFVDQTGPLPGPSTDAATASAAEGLVDNWPNATLGELPIGSKALVGGKVHTIDHIKGAAVLTVLPDGSAHSLLATTIPDKVAQSPKNDTVGDLQPNTPFWMDGTSHTVVAHSTEGIVIKSNDGSLSQVPANTPYQKWGAPVPNASEAPPKEGKVGDLKDGEVFEGASGELHKVIVHSDHGGIVVMKGDQPGGSMNQIPPNTPLNQIDAATKAGIVTEAPKSDWSQYVKGQLEEAGTIMDDVPTLYLASFKSKWGSGGKYQHHHIEELFPGSIFADKTGLEYAYIGQGPPGMALVKDGEGNLHLVALGTRVKLI